MEPTERPPAIVRWTQRLEDTAALDAPVSALEPKIRALFGSGPRGSVLRGDWLGHAVHPVLTDFVLGTWTSATVLDAIGGNESSVAARRLIGAGLLAAGTPPGPGSPSQGQRSQGSAATWAATSPPPARWAAATRRTTIR
jgi:hypothetical protein